MNKSGVVIVGGGSAGIAAAACVGMALVAYLMVGGRAPAQGDPQPLPARPAPRAEVRPEPGESVALPTGVRISPLVATGAVFQALDPELTTAPNFRAGHAVTSALSPDCRWGPLGRVHFRVRHLEGCASQAAGVEHAAHLQWNCLASQG